MKFRLILALLFSFGLESSAVDKLDTNPGVRAPATPGALKDRDLEFFTPVNINSPLFVETKTLAGKKVNLASEYAGRVVLLVNVASKCGLTPQYKELQTLHEKYAKQGLAIVGVPCNQFRGQEPGTAEEILSFCQKNYGVEFDLLEKQNVKLNEPNQSPLYKRLTDKKAEAKFPGDIRWNFEKFLFGRDGGVVARFDPPIKPTDKKIVEAIKKELAEAPPKKTPTPTVES